MIVTNEREGRDLFTLEGMTLRYNAAIEDITKYIDDQLSEDHVNGLTALLEMVKTHSLEAHLPLPHFTLSFS
jgi:hypothetical protein